MPEQPLAREPAVDRLSDDMGPGLQKSSVERQLRARLAQDRARLQEAATPPQAAPRTPPPQPSGEAPAEGKVPVGEAPKRFPLTPDPITRFMSDIPAAAVNAVLDAGGEFTETLLDLTKPLADTLESYVPLGQALSPEQVESIRSTYRGLRLDDPQSKGGQVVKSVAQFLVGLVPALKATRGLRALGPVGSWSQPLVAGSLADVATIDEHERRLSNLIEDVPALQNPVTEFLQAREDDSAAEGKLKQAVEGMALGALGDGLVKSLKLLRRARQALGRSRLPETGEPPPLPDDLFRRVTTDPNAPLVKIDDNMRDAVKRLLSTPLGQTPDIPDEIIGNINFGRIDGPAALRDAMKRMARAFKLDELPETQTFAQVRALADEIGKDPDELARLMTQGGSGFTGPELTALRFTFTASAKGIDRLTRLVVSGGASDVDKLELLQRVAAHRVLLGAVSGAAREAGRALGALRIMTTAGNRRVQERTIRELLGKLGSGDLQQGILGGESIERFAQAWQALDSAAQKAQFVSQLSARRIFMEAFINGMLSGPKTHVVNMSGNLMTIAGEVPERILAATIRKAIGGEGSTFREVPATLHGILQGMDDGLRAAWRAFRTETPGDRFVKIEGLNEPAISSEAFGAAPDTVFGRAVDALGALIRLPGRALMAEDEFFKSIGYRASLHQQAARAAARVADRKEAARVYADILANPPETINAEAIDHARYLTFTRELGSVGKATERFANTHPIIRTFAPFIRTPVNILKYMGERTPLAPLSANIRADIAAGGARADTALARIALGTMLTGLAMKWTLEGKLTGPGPADPATKGAWLASGWRPNSIRIGDRYIPYNRFDPFAGILGLAAAYTEIAGQLDPEQQDHIFTTISLGMTNVVLSKTWMSTMADLAEVSAASILSPELATKMAEDFAARYSSNFVPYSGLVRQTAAATDPIQRDTTGLPVLPPGEGAFFNAKATRSIQLMLDSLWNAMDDTRDGIEGFSARLPARINELGEPISFFGGLGEDNADTTINPGPAALAHLFAPTEGVPVEDSPLKNELRRLNIGISKLPRSIPGPGGVEVELTPQEYHDYAVQLGRKVHSTLNQLISGKVTDPEVRAFNTQTRFTQRYRSPHTNDVAREVIIRKTISEIRRAERLRFLRDHPEIQARMEEALASRVLPQLAP